ncbi:dimethylglycine dehydrogenase, mitochondrial-like isoform X1 [Bolinopsis microptera]
MLKFGNRNNFLKKAYNYSRSLSSKPNGFLEQHESVETRHAKDNAEVVIIGGGCVGTSLAYHLAKFGVKNVVLLEKTELTAGSTYSAAGLTTYYNHGINMRNLHYESLKLFETIEAETDQEIGFNATGSLRLAHTKEHFNEFKYMMSRHTWHRANEHLVDPDTIEQMHPFLNMEGIKGGLYTPGDGHTDPYSLTMAYAKGARMYGATLVQDCIVTGTKQRADGTWEVDTPSGKINTKQLVNAAGFHAREIGQMSGLNLPLAPVHHQYLVSASVPLLEDWQKNQNGRQIPTIRDLRGSYYVRQERTGLLIGPYEAPDKMKIQEDWYDNGIPRGFSKEAYESDLDRIDRCIEHCMELMPIMQETEIQNAIAGPITYSPDMLPMMGPTHHLTNYWLTVGFGCFGIVHSGGAGKYLARWMINGEPDYDLIECDPDRFSDWTDRKFLMEKARESYGMNTSPAYPKEERWAGRPTERVSGAYQEIKERGAAFGFNAGWEQARFFATQGELKTTPACYTRKHWHDAVGREVDLLLNGVGVADLTYFGKFILEGPGATKFLSSMVANTLPKEQQVNLSHMLTPNGKVYAELTISRLGKERYYLVTSAGSELHDLRWLKHHMPENAEFTLQNVTDQMGVLAVTGKYSRDVMTKLTDSAMSHEDFPFLECREMSLAGYDVQATRISYTGELGWEIHHDRNDTGALYKRILEAGAEFEIGDYGWFATNSLRLEKGLRHWGDEMNLDKNPFEAGLGSFIKTNKKTPFIGQEACKEMLGNELKSKLVMLTVDTHGYLDPEGNETIWFDNQVVGNTTSGAWSYSANTSICMAYLPTSLTELGSNVYVELLGKRYKATVVNDPMYETEAVRSRNDLKEDRADFS